MTKKRRRARSPQPVWLVGYTLKADSVKEWDPVVMGEDQSIKDTISQKYGAN